MLLQRGANLGDLYSMCELARSYYFDSCSDVYLPLALSYWQKAAKNRDNGAMDDLERLDGYIYQRIKSYNDGGSEYENILTRCAMLTEYHLTNIGRTDWSRLDNFERMKRLQRLADEFCDMFGFYRTPIFCEYKLSFNGMIVDGLATPENTVIIREEILDDYERTIQILFHEVGHHLTFEMWRGTPRGMKLREICNIDEARVKSWIDNAQGIEVTTTEEDPDTISYVVYTQWAVFFAERKN